MLKCGGIIFLPTELPFCGLIRLSSIAEMLTSSEKNHALLCFFTVLVCRLVCTPSAARTAFSNGVVTVNSRDSQAHRDGFSFVVRPCTYAASLLPMFLLHLNSLSTCWPVQEPIITEIFPDFGPKSGGTMLTIRGDYLDSGTLRQVSIGNAPCQLQRWGSPFGCHTEAWARSEWEGSSTLKPNWGGFACHGGLADTPPVPCSASRSMLTCRTPPHGALAQVPVSLNINSAPIEAPGTFSYNQDPFIAHIQPSRSFIRWGGWRAAQLLGG